MWPKPEGVSNNLYIIYKEFVDAEKRKMLKGKMGLVSCEIIKAHILALNSIISGC